MFLLPVGGVVDFRFGILTAPNHKGVPVGIKKGMLWAADLGCINGPEYVKRYDKQKARTWLDTMKEYKDTCLFVTAPDFVGQAQGTLSLYKKFLNWPTAFVAQDGQESLHFPEEFDALFIGGTTEWKISSAAIECIRRAQKLGKHIHIGRVNWKKRYDFFRTLPGGNRFTFDGTRSRYEGTEKTIEAWAGYMAQSSLFDSGLLSCDSSG